MLHAILFAVASLSVLVGCKEPNPRYCGFFTNAERCSGGGDGGSDGPCKTNENCTDPATPVCDTSKPGGGVCVQCMGGHPEQCTLMLPHCDLDTETCSACIGDDDCGATGVCLLDGSCADPGNIIHAVATNGSTDPAACGGLGPGNACDLQTALAKAKTESGIQGSRKNVIKLDDVGSYTAGSNFVVDVDARFGLVIDAGKASLEHTSDGPLVTLNNGNGVTILGGTIKGAHGPGGDGIRCNVGATLTLIGTKLVMNDESGIKSGCALTVVAAEIRDNTKPGIVISDGSIKISRSLLSNNIGGGITVIDPGKFVVVGNVFLGNGDTGTIAGGLAAATMASGNRLEFNTFAENKSSLAVGAGIQCTVAGLTPQNNIVWNNNGASALQVGGDCVHFFSDIGPSAIPTTPVNLDGGNNMSMDPKFMAPTADLRLISTTPVRGKANPNADLSEIASKDVTGAPRVKPADLGAYVAPPM